jgi:hypothetical protein
MKLLVHLLLVVASCYAFIPVNRARPRVSRSSLQASMTSESEEEVSSGLRLNKAASVALGAMFLSMSPFAPPLRADAVPLGSHTTCSYPACTTKEEILMAANTGLMPDSQKEGLVADLKDIQFILNNAFSAMMEQKDYPSIRTGLRQSPMINLRLTVRKYKELLPEDTRKDFMAKYSTMIDNLDSFDVFVFKRTQGGSSDKEVLRYLDQSISTYSDMMKSAGIESTATAAPAVAVAASPDA